MIFFPNSISLEKRQICFPSLFIFQLDETSSPVDNLQVSVNKDQ